MPNTYVADLTNVLGFVKAPGVSLPLTQTDFVQNFNNIKTAVDGAAANSTIEISPRPGLDGVRIPFILTGDLTLNNGKTLKGSLAADGKPAQFVIGTSPEANEAFEITGTATMEALHISGNGRNWRPTGPLTDYSFGKIINVRAGGALTMENCTIGDGVPFDPLAYPVGTSVIDWLTHPAPTVYDSAFQVLSAFPGLQVLTGLTEAQLNNPATSSDPAGLSAILATKTTEGAVYRHLLEGSSGCVFYLSGGTWFKTSQYDQVRIFNGGSLTANGCRFQDAGYNLFRVDQTGGTLTLNTCVGSNCMRLADTISSATAASIINVNGGSYVNCGIGATGAQGFLTMTDATFEMRNLDHWIGHIMKSQSPNTVLTGCKILRRGSPRGDGEWAWFAQSGKLTAVDTVFEGQISHGAGEIDLNNVTIDCTNYTDANYGIWRTQAGETLTLNNVIVKGVSIAGVLNQGGTANITGHAVATPLVGAEHGTFVGT